MKSKKRYTVACLSGDGIGPELMAEASRALHGGRGGLHGFRSTRCTRRSPARRSAATATRCRRRRAPPCREADAVLVALTREPALEGVKADLDLTWRVQRVAAPRTATSRSSARSSTSCEPSSSERAFDLARSRRGDGRRRRATATAWSTFVGCGGGAPPGRRGRAAVAERGAAAADERAGRLLRRRHRSRRTPSSSATWPPPAATAPRIVASGRLSPTGPGVFGPTHGSAPSIAGQGVANPSGMLLAAALMLGEGLGERAAARTLERAVSHALAAGVRTADLDGSGPAATTRDFMDAVLDADAVGPHGRRVLAECGR